MTYDNILVETHDSVGLIRLNRPQALNALSQGLVADLNAALKNFAEDAAIGAIVITGSERAFAAGADIKEIEGATFSDAFMGESSTRGIRRPRAKTGHRGSSRRCARRRLRTGDDVRLHRRRRHRRFGQPEIKLGTIPGAGGTQRLARFVGKSKAMDMILTGRMMDAAEAERSGLASRVFPAAELVAKAIEIAKQIAALGAPSVWAAKECVNAAYQMTLDQGVRYERRVFFGLFATEDQKEGMRAFVEKRPAQFKNR